MTKDMSRKDFESQIAERSLTDPAFRTAMLADPAATLDREYGVKVPANIKVEVLEESAATMYLVLPKAPAQTEAGGEISPEQLEAVAGGAARTEGWTWCCIITLYT